MDSGVAQVELDLDLYRENLETLFGGSREIMRAEIQKAQSDPKRIVFPEGDEDKILRASQLLLDEKIATPILLGARATIQERCEALDLEMKGAEIVEPTPEGWASWDSYVETLYELRQRRGIMRWDAAEIMRNRNLFGSMMVAWATRTG